ncbi:hypothetical protein C4573_05910 [Candidatus Woesearchaeota archaeon]|nr:MAG: hypothetical protein C4573_05910 [Candidatus Woesearchaeota archaeon]
MNKVIDAVAVVVFLAAVVGIFFIRAADDATGRVIEEPKSLSSENVMYPNVYYDFRFCYEKAPGILQIGLENRQTGEMEKYALEDTADRTKQTSYRCEQGSILKVVTYTD